MMKRIVVFLLVGFLFFLLTSPVSAEESIEYKLAVIDTQEPVERSGIKVARFRSLLNQLSTTYVETKQQIADMTVFAKQDLRKSGIKESMLNMMEGMNKLLPQKISNQKYAEYLTMYITLRDKGQSHTEAISGIKALLKAFIK